MDRLLGPGDEEVSDKDDGDADGEEDEPFRHELERDWLVDVPELVDEVLRERAEHEVHEHHRQEPHVERGPHEEELEEERDAPARVGRHRRVPSHPQKHEAQEREEHDEAPKDEPRAHLRDGVLVVRNLPPEREEAIVVVGERNPDEVFAEARLVHDPKAREDHAEDVAQAATREHERHHPLRPHRGVRKHSLRARPPPLRLALLRRLVVRHVVQGGKHVPDRQRQSRPERIYVPSLDRIELDVDIKISKVELDDVDVDRHHQQQQEKDVEQRVGGEKVEERKEPLASVATDDPLRHEPQDDVAEQLEVRPKHRKAKDERRERAIRVVILLPKLLNVAHQRVLRHLEPLLVVIFDEVVRHKHAQRVHILLLPPHYHSRRPDRQQRHDGPPPSPV
mmetsp:Transcript_15402/g.50612  ORF Transcript_15402/g.50612 Transcript_15402/m.50612 type:complete len:394 (+) Transcript_15402:305-1486(+)